MQWDTGMLAKEVTRILRRYPDGLECIALRLDALWDGDTTMQVGDTSWWIRNARTPLEFRKALVDADRANAPLVICSLLSEHELAMDLRSRIAGGRQHSLDIRRNLGDRLGLRPNGFDSQIRRLEPLAAILLANEPAQGFNPIPSGLLDQDGLMGLFAKHVLGFDDSQLTGRLILEWSRNRDKVQNWCSLPADVQESWLMWLRSKVTVSLEEYLFRLLSQKTDIDLVSNGLICLSVTHAALKDRPEVLVARGRFEAGLGSTIDSKILQAWAEATECYLSLSELPYVQEATLADETLIQMQLEPLTVHLDWSPSGLSKRYQTYAMSICEVLANPNAGDKLTQARKALQHIRLHRLHKNNDRLEMACMALRLLQSRSIQQEIQKGMQGADLARHIQWYQESISWIDSAREFLGADTDAIVQDAYRQLQESTHSWRETFNKSFATFLYKEGLSSQNASEWQPIENVIARFIAPLAQQQKILLIMMDGMSVANATEIATDLQSSEAWIAIDPATGPPEIISTIPSLTEYARTSFFAGHLRKGDSAEEQKFFSQHEALLSSCKGEIPLLFHKANLEDGPGTGLSTDLRNAIQSSKKVVALVWNAIDDSLAKGTQVIQRWNRSCMPVFAAALDAAANAGRLVILVSDHGHMLERFSDLKSGNERGGDRWMEPNGELTHGEMVLRGERIEKWAPAVQVPWTETLRYSTKKRGYHGGITPQEMVVPFWVFQPSREQGVVHAGWGQALRYTPSWWDTTINSIETTSTSVPAPANKATRGKKAAPEATQQNLFLNTDVPEAKPQPWIDTLLSMELFKERLKKQPQLNAEKVRRSLQAFPDLAETRLGKLPFCQSVGEPEFRMRGLVAQLARVFNMDGADCISMLPGEDVVILRRDLLLRQFGVKS